MVSDYGRGYINHRNFIRIHHFPTQIIFYNIIMYDHIEIISSMSTSGSVITIEIIFTIPSSQSRNTHSGQF